jgi:hypothetical protein
LCHWLVSASLPILLIVVLPLGAANIDVAFLLDADNDASTGCTVHGMTGVEHVLVTTVATTDASANVTAVRRQVCAGGTLDAPLDVDTAGWPAGYDGETGQLRVETRIPRSALSFADEMPTIRWGFAATFGETTRTLTTAADGSPDRSL